MTDPDPVRDAPNEDARVQARQAVTDHYRERANVEPTHAAMMRAVVAEA